MYNVGFEFYIISMSMLVSMHLYDFKCRIVRRNTKQIKDDLKRKENYYRTGNTEDGVNSKGERM